MNTAKWVQRNPLKNGWGAFALRGREDATQDIDLAVFVKGNGPGVIVTHELPGMSRACIRLAEEIVAAGFRVYLPLFFGAPGKTNMVGNSLRLFCLKREFEYCARHKSGVITQWLNELSRRVRQECPHDGVGVIGMCLTGNFALAMMKYPDHGIKAPVLSQPSLPIYIPGLPGSIAQKRATGLDSATINAVVDWAKQEKAHNPDFYMPIFQFAEDFLSPPARLEGFKNDIGACYFEPPDGADVTISKEVRQSAGIPRGQTHSVLTGYFDGNDSRDRPDPTQRARDILLEYLRQQLKNE